jgi:hypothetical protein
MVININSKMSKSVGSFLRNHFSSYFSNRFVDQVFERIFPGSSFIRRLRENIDEIEELWRRV